MSKLVAPHGGKGLVCALLEGSAREAELKKAKGLKVLLAGLGDLVRHVSLGPYSDRKSVV